MTTPSYPKILQYGKLDELFDGPIEVTEKVDGSQFGFGIDADQNLVMRSKGVQLHPPVDGMFRQAVESVLECESLIRSHMAPSVFAYGEYLNAPKHNTLEYERVPLGNIALFSVWDSALDRWWEYQQVSDLAWDLGLEVVPLLGRAEIDPMDLSARSALKDRLEGYFERESILGGQKIEGVVIKNLSQRVHYNGKMHPVFCKLVSADFKEKHNESWSPQRDRLQDYLHGFKAPARWDKAIHRLRDEGRLEYDPRDIGLLIREVQADLVAEEVEQIKSDLLAHFLPQIKRICVHGFPEYYKQHLFAESADLVANA